MVFESVVIAAKFIYSVKNLTYVVELVLPENFVTNIKRLKTLREC